MNELGPTPPPRHRQLGALVCAQAPPVGPRLAGEPERPSIARLSRWDRLVVLVGLTGIVGLSWASVCERHRSGNDDDAQAMILVVTDGYVLAEIYCN